MYMPAEKKKPVQQYEHKNKQRVNTPPVGLGSSDTDEEIIENKTYSDASHLANRGGQDRMSSIILESTPE
jgi:hypothetical protein